ncbi:glycerol-3-phosphate dehydrogenase [Ponticoccus sp. SC2-23]|uniref:glycerol-3-phosphate dehydrogenase n=1 Tax=Alexandriicola marinus TaxID=2081710 RepID=UPI000FD8B7A6|nr:glycerol-3-phosphate dehydrogenase [Alexandriicola marinus]MBM1220008.1 glycerol-3-phosphate dehydrogenase [Ponticoccus sp. SC6-9]MBM1224694.1 glycerol-3-phosphate dehydrogenase [Ponticoccus sp. SC6-15]MBM1228207.1 glycerol-3-phosphate dehydrogenase [Ponticoccus sp. SC6-38]MBM1234155.1 glycerol-3-phosphate dehydrogenase [Ponticoccus sp. SC6-45]MBM1238709.1 glycerol-3-phosphate dehydrogenase [Ponticoccus sp. SC6-49]MBM1242490.1 glycerol-3-phosphate dehydrogenase [Ponticoccus sp. SC2-64]MBM
MTTEYDYDLFIIGGGINGCGIARDAVGRGLSVGLAEMNDLASATSSASTKLFHGGLRYLEFFEFRLVRESLIERERLLQAMPHISWPMRFVLPYHADMRFESSTPTSRLLSTVMPWMKGRRPRWLIRLGLFLYDTLGGRKILPGTTRLDLTRAPEGKPLDPKFKVAYEYSDCWVEDSRLVALNARDAAERGADIMVRTKVTSARAGDGGWIVALDGPDGPREVRARMLVNAGGPWVGQIIQGRISLNSREGVRLVKGSHIVVPRLYDHDKCYFFQGTDGRIIFAIPYETDFTLIGTTDREHDDPDTTPTCSEAEQEYLCNFASQYFAKPVTRDQIVWTYSGVRPLYDDGAQSATAATRDYTLKIDRSAGAPVLNIFGGKITTYRRLAEHAMEKITPEIGGRQAGWTAGVPLPGGDFPVGDVPRLIADLREAYPFLDETWARRLIRAYGTDAQVTLNEATSPDDLGRDFGATLTEREVGWLMTHEFARTAEDVVWRRNKLGLRMTADQIAALDDWMQTGRAA